ncbi:MAG: TatD family hydrolase [Lachnospiraceae bacterium]|nr:TatD family hydrolase [Lachnospiraceae bacterium]
MSKYGIIDSHAHICGNDLFPRFEQVVADAKAAGICRILIVCTEVEEAKRAVQIAENDPMFDVALAFYPNDVLKASEEDFAEMEKLVRAGKTIAVGEIGMDTVGFGDVKVPLSLQEKAFIRQIQLANECNKPILVHMREATEYTLPIMKQYLKVPGIMHCYSGGYDVMQEFLDMGMYLSFSGNITFEDDQQTYLAVKNVPLDRILIETDAPSLIPAPMQGKPNEPSYIVYVIERICEIRGCSKEELIEAVYHNYHRLFGIAE